jgi:hypothetical protein
VVVCLIKSVSRSRRLPLFSPRLFHSQPAAASRRSSATRRGGR